MLYLICFIKKMTVKYGNRVVEKISSKDRLDKLEKRNKAFFKKITI
jgi:hypothetical protein